VSPHLCTSQSAPCRALGGCDSRQCEATPTVVCAIPWHRRLIDAAGESLETGFVLTQFHGVVPLEASGVLEIVWLARSQPSGSTN
jgi:hypothetical protein